MEISWNFVSPKKWEPWKNTIANSYGGLRKKILEFRFHHLNLPSPLPNTFWNFSWITLTLRRLHCFREVYRPSSACYIIVHVDKLGVVEFSCKRTNPWVAFIFSMPSGERLSTWQIHIVCLHSGAIYNSYQWYNETAYVKLTSWSPFVYIQFWIYFRENVLEKSP